MLMIQYTHEDVNRIFMQNQQNFLDPWNPLESFPCCYRNASDLHFYPVHDRRFWKKPLTLIKNQVPGYTTALGTQSSAATIPVNLQCAEADGVCNCRLSDEPASDQSRNCHSVHHDTRHRNGRFPGSSWRFHHDCSSVPVHGIRRRSRRSGRHDLRDHGCTLHHTGFLRNSLQHFR